MKKVIVTLLIILGSFTVQAQESLTWETNLNKAIERSKTENKPMFLFFTGSDWCGWCIRLQKEVFKTPEFEAWAKEKVVLVDLDFPRRTPQPDDIKKQNIELQQIFQVQGYPTVWFAKAGAVVDGKSNLEKLGSTGYVAGGPSKWLEGANQIIAKFTPYPVAEKTKKTKKKKKAKA